MQRLISSAAGIIAASVVGTLPAWAHHSTAKFDTRTVVKIKGAITEFHWGNPHASIEIRGKAEGVGISGFWTVRMTAPNELVDDGWTRRTIKPGETVTLYVNLPKGPATPVDGVYDALYVGVILANGKALGRVDGKPRQRAGAY